MVYQQYVQKWSFLIFLSIFFVLDHLWSPNHKDLSLNVRSLSFRIIKNSVLLSSWNEERIFLHTYEILKYRILRIVGSKYYLRHQTSKLVLSWQQQNKTNEYCCAFSLQNMKCRKFKCTRNIKLFAHHQHDEHCSKVIRPPLPIFMHLCNTQFPFFNLNNYYKIIIYSQTV